MGEKTLHAEAEDAGSMESALAWSILAAPAHGQLHMAVEGAMSRRRSPAAGVVLEGSCFATVAASIAPDIPGAVVRALRW